MSKIKLGNRDVGEKKVVYPPAPWYMSGQMWMGLFKTDQSIPLPPELTPLLCRNRLVVALVRYADGTLQYDELAFGVLVYFRKRISIFVDYIWVNDEQALWGGRHIWGVPKKFANFSWHQNTVILTDDNGHIITLTVNREDAKLAPIKFSAPGLGRIGDHWAFSLASFQACIGCSGLRIDEWTDRFLHRPMEKPTLSFAAKPFHMSLLAPKLLAG